MFRPRNVAVLALAVAVATTAGVAAATRHAQGTQPAAATINATSVTQSSSRACDAADGTYQETNATYSGTATSTDPRLNGALVLRVHSILNTTTHLGWLEGSLRVRGTGTGASAWLRAAIANGSAVGTIVGDTGRPGSRLVASFTSPFDQSTGFQNGAIGSGSANGAGVFFSRGDCRRPDRGPATAVFRIHLRPFAVVPPVKGLDAAADGSLTLDLTRDASGDITGGNVVFYVNYRFPGAVTITGFALHQGTRGTNGPVVLDSAVGTVTDPDGRGNLTKVVGGASASLLQGLLSNPHGYYVDFTTSANTGGALRDQLEAPTRR